MGQDVMKPFGLYTFHLVKTLLLNFHTAVKVFNILMDYTKIIEVYVLLTEIVYDLYSHCLWR